MVNYQLGKIYKIVDNTNGNIYIGSTCKPYLSSRLAGHKNNYKNYLQGLFCFMTSFKILENGDYDIVLVEKYPCDDKMQLHARERHYIDTLECVNRVHPLRTKQEYYHEHKEEMLVKNKEYRIINKDAISAQSKLYRDLNRDKIKAHKKLYHEANQEKIKAHKKEYYNANKDAINARKKEFYKLKKVQQNILDV